MGNVYEALRKAEIDAASSGSVVGQEWTCREVSQPLAFPSNRLEGAGTLARQDGNRVWSVGNGSGDWRRANPE